MNSKYYDFDAKGQPYLDTHLPYCTSRGEEALIRSEVFRRNNLTLHCNVPAQNLAHAVDPDDSIWNAGHIDYLVCRGPRAVLAVSLLRDLQTADTVDGPPQLKDGLRDPSGRKLLPCAMVSENDLLQGRTRFLLQALEQVLAASDRREFPCRIHVFTNEEFHRFSQPNKGLLALTSRGTFITEYGVSYGIFRIRTSTGRHNFCCFPQDLKKLEEAEFSQKIQIPNAVTFEERAERIRNGLPCSTDALTEMVRGFAETPLTEYLQDFPQQLERFQAILGEQATYQDAARYISALMRREQPGVCAFNDRSTEGKQLMLDLAAPVLASLPYASKRVYGS